MEADSRDGGAFTAAVTAVFGLLILLLVQYLLKRWLGRKKGSSVLLLGPCGGGKTVLYLQLKEGSTLNGTVASMDENSGVFRPKGQESGAPIHFVDLPGHPRLKHKIDSYIKDAAGIVFVLDSTVILQKAKEVAEHLYDVLVHPVFHRRRLPILLACNKADLGPKSHSDTFIVKQLEKEINGLRSTRSTLAGEGDVAVLGIDGKDFSFKDLKSKVTISKISAITGDIDPVLQFVGKCVSH